MAIDLTLYQMVMFAAIGALGGITRELVTHPQWKDWQNNYAKILYQLGSAAIIGAFIGILIDNTLIMAGLSGYAGSDALEELMKNKGISSGNRKNEF